MTSLATWVKLAPSWSYACRVDAYDGSTRPSGQPDPQAELLQRGVDQHQGPHQIGPESGEVDRDHRAHAVADDDTRLATHRVHDIYRLLRPHSRHTARTAGAAAMTTQVRYEQIEATAEASHDRQPPVRVRPEAMHEQQPGIALGGRTMMNSKLAGPAPDHLQAGRVRPTWRLPRHREHPR